MRSEPTPAWRPTGLHWNSRAEAHLGWLPPDQGPERSSPLLLGGELTVRVGPDRACTGVWRGGRRVPCPARAVISPAVVGGQCEDCSVLARVGSVAADGRPEDPRAFRVYLAGYAPDVLKVGITAAERGVTRLLEQGAVAAVFVGEGPLMAARAAERNLAAHLGVPDRISAAAKRRARARPGTARQRLDALQAAHRHALDSPGRPETVRPTVPAQPDDHAAVYGLPDAGLVPDALLGPLHPGAVITGRVTCRIGSDLYLDTAHGLVMADTRLLAGWALDKAPPGAAFTATTEAHHHPEEHTHDALF
jgi:hypothetical protein